MEQRTIKHSVSCFGVGIHSGKPTSLTMYPAAENSGIVFIRTDIQNKLNKIKARYDSVSKTTLGTTIANEEGTEIAIIEHLMAALWGCKIDNIVIEVDGPEIPIMDGSSESFVFLVECAGVKKQSAKRQCIEILESISIKDGDSTIELTPSKHLSIETGIEFQDKVISSQQYNFSEKNKSFKHDISRARTFGYKHEAEMLKKMGLAKGASLENAIVISEDKVLNKDGLRYKDEFVRHKTLDLIGDFYLAGMPIKGHVKSYKPGHTINNKMLRKLFANPQAFRIIEAA
ncbi:MAG: UDP-3-O-acyl-N-acetylglucosamine deacetylase [Alphaproteobacteria bacterium]|nr:UDP-3-O-acyl-N-acetylglucosamine deacetylase [Alphaproteobacteria bacterium]